jgi:5-formyltetrahydrofolate cyclo-ligase
VDSEKRDLRAKIRERRRFQVAKFDLTPLLESPEFKAAQVIASYRSYGNEPVTSVLNQLIIDSGRTLLLPRLEHSGILNFASWNGDPLLLTRNGRIEEPIGPTYEGSIDLVILPSLAADHNGMRLGQGGGSYDRTLVGMHAWRVTLLNENELVPHLPSQSHDQPIDAVLLPNRLVRL